MSELDFKKIGLKVGLEIHQQLATNKKLFCNCNQIESDEYTKKFSRKLRITKSEMGEYDPAAIFEKNKSKTIMYFSNPQSSCLVEEDEEPPHDVEVSAKNTALLIALALKSKIFREIFPMRKIVIDGSNTSGFQRTMLVSQGGNLDVNGKSVGVQSICLEEDAAKLIGDKGDVREYSLDRLGIPLVEIALEPVEAGPKEMKNIALTLGRLLRTTKKVRRGLGSIRQDVNVSVIGGGIVEVKGVQQLDQLEKVVEFEAKRQDGLMKIAKKLQEMEWEEISEKNFLDITEDMKNCKSKIVQKALKDNFRIRAVRFRNFSGIFSYSPYEGIRLGKEIAQLVRFYGIGGVFHSDELPNYGIEESDVKMIREKLDAKENDGFLIIALPKSKYTIVPDQIINRINEARKGVPAETRLATQIGETVFLRPRPGPSRMYPETDIPAIIVSEKELSFAKEHIPKSWDEMLSELKENYQLNSQLAEQIFDSVYLELFENICNNEEISPNFVASVLCSTITNLGRKGLDANLLKNEIISKTFTFLTEGKITKESIEIIFENIMAGKSNTVEEAIQKSAISTVSDDEISNQLDEVINKNTGIIDSQGTRSVDPLMGVAMKALRGKASGEKISQLLIEKIQKYLDTKK